MKIKLTSLQKTRGYIIILVMILAAASLLILTGILSYTTTTANLNMRSNELSLCQNAAEAATEKVYAKMAYDFNAYGIGQVSNNFAAGIYQALVPNSSDDSYFSKFNFYDPTSPTNAGRVYVGYLTNYAGPLPTQYTNQFASTNSMIYRIVSNVTMPGSFANNVIGTAQEDVLFALVPINTFAIFYNGELEFSQCATMDVTGRTHSNADICTGTSASLTFSAPVTCCSVIQSPNRGGYTFSSLNENTTYQEGSTTDVVSLQISIPMTNAHSIIQPQSPAVVPPSSALGQQMEYYEAQVVLIVSNAVSGVTSATNASVYITLQVANEGGVPASGTLHTTFNLTNHITTAQLQTNQNNATNIALPFLTFTNSFADQREHQLNMFVTQINVGAYADWATTNLWATNYFNPALNQYPTILYVADERTFATSNRLAVVRLVNAQRLPYNNNLGFTVATENPLYIVGNYNSTTNKTGVTVTNSSLAIGSTTNGFTVPAALLSDAITVLSSNWSDSLSSGSYTARTPLNTTLNAAIVTGNVPSTGTSSTTFSGGVENLTRLLENWTGYTLTYNTSIVCLYSSQMATNQFQDPDNYYTAPTRNWGFDPTFYNPTREPPGIPESLVPIRFNWQQPPPGSVTTGLN